MKRFFGKMSIEARKETARDRKMRELRLAEVDRRFGMGPSEERILACAAAQLRAEIADRFWGSSVA